MELPKFIVLLLIAFCTANLSRGLPYVRQGAISWRENMERSRCVKACSQYSEKKMTGSWDTETMLCSCMDASGAIAISAPTLTIENVNRNRLGITPNRLPCTEYHIRENLPCTVD
ncbi:uncharacterized protein LOC107039433 [Diachasma alloeum]|uniref:uncharacterized protein LOC107039433 n=1 Tax=Diachasma alloeum TaxID=454923 RepID=UPI00073811B0|nr:uncharacterized protein LOC107039433 [Diachasma alloeum]